MATSAPTDSVDAVLSIGVALGAVRSRVLEEENRLPRGMWSRHAFVPKLLRHDCGILGEMSRSAMLEGMWLPGSAA